MHGLTLDGVIIEEGVSGSVPVFDRPKGGELFAKLAKGDVVIAPKLDRLFRSALDALQWSRICANAASRCICSILAVTFQATA